MNGFDPGKHPEKDGLSLEEKLLRYGQSDFYPFHMPGHKRQRITELDPYREDITEIDGFDNLNHPEGILQDLEAEFAEAYGADGACLLVNGSTGGNLASVYAAVHDGETVLVQRNSHKSVFHGLMMKHVKTVYLCPECDAAEIPGWIAPEEVEDAFRRDPEIHGVFLTSPSYEGVIQDIPRIAAVCREHHAPLIVDDAHGAHLGLSGEFPENPLREGADIAVMSLHKMLPAMTQTALLVWKKNDYVSEEDLRDAVSVFQTSSPSYILMASASASLHYLKRNPDCFTAWKNRLDRFYRKTRDLKNLRLLPEEVEDPPMGDSGRRLRDPSKIVILSKVPGVTGNDLMRNLREAHHLELEMASGFYALAMTSMMDTEEGMERLTAGLKDLDQSLDEKGSGPRLETDAAFGEPESIETMRKSGKEPDQVLPLWKAADAPWETVSLPEAADRISKDLLAVYPPGIPLVLPGERIPESVVEKITEALKDGLSVDGVDKKRRVRVIR